MQHETKEEGKALVVSFSGDVDLESSPRARKTLLEAVERKRPVLVDLSGVGYIDSSGIACLVEAFQKAKKGGIAFILVSASEAALRVLQLARLDKVFVLSPSVDEALAKIG